jgi:hypothetical protein
VLGFWVVLLGLVAASGFDLLLGLAEVVPLPVSEVVLVPVGVPIAPPEDAPLLLLRTAPRPPTVMLSRTRRLPA